MNKFNVPDAEPFVVNFISFAGYDGAPMEFFYNCKPSNETKTNKNDQLFSSINERKLLQSDPTIKKVKFESSHMHLSLLFLNVMTLLISITILVCIFSMQ